MGGARGWRRRSLSKPSSSARTSPRAFNNSAEMLEANRNGEAAKRDFNPLDELEALCARRRPRRGHGAARRRGRGEQVPRFAPQNYADGVLRQGYDEQFKAFAKAVGKQLNLTGCRRPNRRRRSAAARRTLETRLRGRLSPASSTAEPRPAPGPDRRGAAEGQPPRCGELM